MTQIFFGLGTGRVASMTLANALNCESACTCLHEGKARDMETAGEQLLPFLTLQNRLAYENPGQALALAKQHRSQLPGIARERDLAFFGDIAYNNTPFVQALHEIYPDARFIFQFRDCLNFVTSCTAVDEIDETPVGWPPDVKPLSQVEQYISLGRIQPRANSAEAALWPGWSFIARNIWLWAETNRIALDALEQLPSRLVHNMRFEEFRADPVASYRVLRAFLGISDPLPFTAEARLTTRPINKRTARTCDASLEKLDPDQLEVFNTYAQPIRKILGYI